MAKPIRSKYRTFKSLKSLEEAQDRVKREYRDIEDNAIGNIFDPVKIGMDLLPSVFSFFSSRRSKRKNAKQAKINSVNLRPVSALESSVNHFTDYTIGAENADKKTSLNVLNVSKNKGLGRKVLASLIRWQLVELSIWGIKKIVKKKK